ncbi:MAG: hypothetical protein NC307_07415 [Roseburia sp.]|nr:hypothetical protein [Roseburia sp.]
MHPHYGEKQGELREPRTGFFQYLSDVFRFEGLPIFILQGMTLLFVCLMIFVTEDVTQNIPVFMPLFVLARHAVSGEGEKRF